jgi:hypothetical protein
MKQDKSITPGPAASDRWKNVLNWRGEPGRTGVADILRLGIDDDRSWFARWETRLGRVGGALGLALVIQAVSYLLYPFPPHKQLDKYIRYQTMLSLCADPFTTEPLHEPSVRHRILVPVLAWVTGLRGPQYFVLIFVGNILFLWFTVLYLRQHVPPRVAALTAMLLGTTLALITSQSWLTVQDSWANAAIVGCLLRRRQLWTLGPLLFLGLLADERCLATMPLVFLAFHLDDPPEARTARRTRRLLMVLVTCAVYAGLFWYLHQHTSAKVQGYYGYATQKDFIDGHLQGEIFLQQLRYVPAGLWFALRAAWLLPLLLLWHKRRERGLVLWLLFGLAAATGQALLVEDMSRMASLAFPAVLLAVILLNETRPALTILVLGFALMVNVLSPQFQINKTRVTMLAPLPLEWLFPEPATGGTP